MNQFCVPNRRKSMKKASSGLIRKLVIKNIRIQFESCFLENFIFFWFF